MLLFFVFFCDSAVADCICDSFTFKYLQLDMSDADFTSTDYNLSEGFKPQIQIGGW